MTTLAPTRGKITEHKADTEADESPKRGLILTNEAGLRRQNPPMKLVETVIRGLNPGFGNSYCCLKDDLGSYIQALCGWNGFILERCITGGYLDGYVHLRACRPNALTEPARLVKHDYGEPGEVRDLLGVDEVIKGFESFYRNPLAEGEFEWRELLI